MPASRTHFEPTTPVIACSDELQMIKRNITAAVICFLNAACTKGPASSAPQQPAIDTRVLYPSSAAYDPGTRSLLVASYDGSLTRVALSARAPGGDLPPLAGHGRSQVFRVRIDSGRSRIWVLASDAVYLYDARSSRVVARIALNAIGQHSSEHCFPDMALDASGNALVSSAMLPRLMHIDAATHGVTERTLEPNADHDKDFGLSALAFGPNGVTLYGASATTGAVWKIDHASGRAEKLELSHPLFGACALLAVRAQQPGIHGADVALYVAGGFRNEINRVDLRAGSRPSRVTAIHQASSVAVPTDLVAADGEMLIVSSGLSDHPDFGGGGTRLASFPILRLQTP